MHIRKVILPVFFFLITASQVSGQIRKGERYLKKDLYDKAIQVFENTVFDASVDESIIAEYYLAKIHATPEYENYDLEKAHEFIKSAIKRYKKLDDKAIRRLQKKDIGILTLKSQKKQVVTTAYIKAKNLNTYEAYQYFLNNYEGPSPVQYENIIRWRNTQGLKEAQQRNRFHSYQDLYKKHHESFAKYSPENFIVLQQLLFESYINEWSWNSYTTFANNYPQNIYVVDSAAAAEYRLIANSTNIDDFKTFLIGYPNSPFALLAKDNIFASIIEKDNIELYDYALRTFPNHRKINTLVFKYYQKLLSIQEIQSPNDFSKLYPHIPIAKILKIEKNK